MPGAVNHLHFIPVLAGRLEFAMEVRRALSHLRPDVVAVELPAHLQKPYCKAVSRLPQMTVLICSSANGSEDDEAVYLPVEPCDPFAEAVRTAREIRAELVFIDPGPTVPAREPERAPDPFAIQTIGFEKYVSEYRSHMSARSPATVKQAQGLAWKLQGLDPAATVAVVVSLPVLDALLDCLDVPQDEPEVQGSARQEVHLVNPHPDSLAEISSEYPYLQYRYEEFRMMSEKDAVDRRRVQFDVLRHAEETYQTNTGDRVAHWHRRLLARYTRNLAMVNGDLAAGIFDMATAGRSIVDDNYGWEVWESASRYPPQKTDSDLETVRVSADEVWIHTKRLKLRRRLPRFKQTVRPSALKKRKKETVPGEWAKQIDGNAICSYPPEDMVIEDYGRFLKQKAKSLFSEERERIEPFTTSLLDGIDLRETIRHWHEKKIYVRHLERLAGDVGSVIVIFDEDREDRYQYLTTWLGEHQNESDMAFYSTPPFDKVVGPGIGRAEYGGFLMTLPPRRMYDVWSDPDYDAAETKAERLLMAGLDYSVGKLVVYAAAHPPRSVFRSMAERMGHKILYVPLGQLSPTKLKKLRVVHVLDGYARRQEAKDFIW